VKNMDEVEKALETLVEKGYATKTMVNGKYRYGLTEKGLFHALKEKRGDKFE